ncbi:MAG: hypothetical protein ACI82F_004261 [Planctomycetota bacterium]|jgi:hypothetical protein
MHTLSPTLLLLDNRTVPYAPRPAVVVWFYLDRPPRRRPCRHQAAVLTGHIYGTDSSRVLGPCEI